jgi:hypothetical protein
MASNTKKSENKRRRRHRNAGKARKSQLGKHSTPSDAELFAGCGEPGQPTPAVQGQ